MTRSPGRPLAAGTRAVVVVSLLALALASVVVARSAPAAATAMLLTVAAVGIGASVRDAVLGIALLVMAAALDNAGLVAESGALRFTVYQLMAAGALAAMAWRLRSARTAPVSTPLDPPVILFLAAMAFSILWAGDRGDGVVQLARLLSSAALAFMVVQAVRDQRAADVVVWTMLGISALYGALALAEWAGLFALRLPVLYTPGYGIRARVTFHDPNILGSFLVTAALLAVSRGLTLRRGAVRTVTWAAIALTVAGLVVTYSRGSLGALAVGLVAVVALARLRRRTRVAILVALVLVVAGVGAFAVDADWVRDNVLDLGANQSVLGRVRVAEGAVRMFLDHPMGVGLGNFPLVYPEYRPAGATGVIESHTAYLTVLAEAGFLGLAAFAWLLWRFFARTVAPVLRHADADVRWLAVGAGAAGLALCAQSFTYSLEASKFLWLAIGLGAAAWTMWRASADATMLRPDDPAHPGDAAHLERT